MPVTASAAAAFSKQAPPLLVSLVEGAPAGSSLIAATKTPHVSNNKADSPSPPYSSYVSCLIQLPPHVIVAAASAPYTAASCPSAPGSSASSANLEALTTAFARAFFNSKAFAPEACVLRSVGFKRGTTTTFSKGDHVYQWVVEDRRPNEVLLRWTNGVSWLAIDEGATEVGVANKEITPGAGAVNAASSLRSFKFMFGSALFKPLHVHPWIYAAHNWYAKVLLKSTMCQLFLEASKHQHQEQQQQP
ncbi:uncharacterized protein EV422DRAFT_572186 [Fimicolochytrium jonesii]|uniref:uncharacterized protein n=1 Tax=Fimicolochytrium jonesii TaxID=1396493 RepID=UPI0022FE84AE|nr:uncharacterized protein EV422DRAFT_572186 [Fimicolochytrium jonesii]KAI8815988.1 hypothetical protein EV422DRAFT_572186 [Fimicolochytrium jonesii]